jgi:uncharacterized membrane protein
MKEILIQDDINLVEDRLKQFEANTGCELLLVVTNASDPYPGASGRFGLIAGFCLSLIFTHYFEFQQHLLYPLSFFVITLLMTWVGHFPWAKRLALSAWEVDRESAEKSIEYFHTLGTSKVSHKVTAMIMVSVLEKKIHVLVDETLKSKISEKDLEDLLALMRTHFKAGNVGLGLVQSIVNLEEKILTSFKGRVSEVNPSELKDVIHFIHT